MVTPALFWAAMGISTAHAREFCEPDAGFELRGGTLRLENDLFAGTDQNYTNDQPGIVHYDGTNILYLDGHARWKRALELRRDQDNREWILPQVIGG